MSTYRNGDIPDHLLIRRGNFLLTVGTWSKWDALVADVLARYGVRLEITDGIGVMRGTGAFRTRIMQRQVKAHFVSIGQGRLAAAEGTSSHGGEFNGRDALAVDVNNYGRIPLEAFYAAARRAGFEPGYFNGRNGRPYEPWHLIDWEPYRAVAGTAGTGSEGAEFMAKIDDLWQQWLPGQAGVKSAGDAYLLFVEMLTKVRDTTARVLKLNTGAETRDLVWDRPVQRDGKGVPAIQELADAKTLGMSANQKLDELLKRGAVTLSDAQVEALAERVGEKVALSVAPGVLNLMSERLKS